MIREWKWSQNLKGQGRLETGFTVTQNDDPNEA